MRRMLLCAVLVLAFALARPAHAGVVNPDISVIGQPALTWNDAVGDPTAKRPVFDVGETEFVFDSALNPYARGMFVASLSHGQIDLEEGYFTILRGLPGDIVLKGGKYRVGFGKLNPAHPHSYPFADRFGVLAAYLPGAESFNETGLDISWRLPLPGDIAVTASGDVLQGDSFRIARDTTGAELNDPLNSALGDRASEPRAAWLGRLSAFVPVGDRSGIELGASATQGTNNVAAGARTRVVGGDLKAKLWTSANAYLLVQGEVLHLDRDNATWGPSPLYNIAKTNATGGYVFADLNWAQRYNVGASFEQFDAPTLQGLSHSSMGLFAGLALMEETTAFRLDWRREHTDPFATIAFAPPASPSSQATTNKLTLRVIYSMGPHKAHQF